jgi:hypothetical protein
MYRKNRRYRDQAVEADCVQVGQTGRDNPARRGVPNTAAIKRADKKDVGSIQGHASVISVFRVTKPEPLIWQRQSRL